MTEKDQLNEIQSLIEQTKQQITQNNQQLEQTNQQLDLLVKDVEILKQETIRTNDRVEIYQKASQQVVNLAFCLIAATAAAIVIPTVLGR